ncbi:MAG: site-specific integrase [Actinomycetota bacterium]|nr:site-specific integrase [Actinomycetota bacterium]
MNPNAAVAGPELHAIPGPGDRLEALYAADRWRAEDLGVPVPGGNATVTFRRISQPWLREAVKRWSRQRLALNCAFNTLRTGALAFKRFSEFLASCQPPVQRPEEVDRGVIERYLAWLAALNLSDSTKTLGKVFLRAFLEENRRYHWVEGIPADAAIYHDELAAKRKSMPRFIPEFLMAQLESETNLSRLKPQYRHLVILISETGLRGGDACSLAFDPLVTDSSGWPCLRFQSWKMRTEHLIPLSGKALEAVRAQQRHVEETVSGGSPWLFPASSDPQLPQGYRAFTHAFASWQKRIGLRDEAGRPARVTPHQLRHTLGTRLINQDVPQHVIQRLLGHASPTMTALYAQLHDATLRREFERYCQTRVGIAGQLLGFDPEALTADAEWVKHTLARVRDSLPNGYCGRPPQQDCPHPNACLTCPDFQTTVTFLPIHRQQAEATRALLDAAEAAGCQRQATNHRKVLANLEKIIPALEAFKQSEAGGGA